MLIDLGFVLAWVDGGRVLVNIDEAAVEKDKIKLDLTPPEPPSRKKEAEDAEA